MTFNPFYIELNLSGFIGPFFGTLIPILLFVIREVRIQNKLRKEKRNEFEFFLALIKELVKEVKSQNDYLEEAYNDINSMPFDVFKPPKLVLSGNYETLIGLNSVNSYQNQYYSNRGTDFHKVLSAINRIKYTFQKIPQLTDYYHKKLISNNGELINLIDHDLYLSFEKIRRGDVQLENSMFEGSVKDLMNEYRNQIRTRKRSSNENEDDSFLISDRYNLLIINAKRIVSQELIIQNHPDNMLLWELQYKLFKIDALKSELDTLKRNYLDDHLKKLQDYFVQDVKVLDDFLKENKINSGTKTEQ